MKTAQDLTTGMQFQLSPPGGAPIPSAPPSYMESEFKYTAEEQKVMHDIYNVAPELATVAKTIPNELRHFGLEGHKARVCLILDISQSMENPNRFFSSKKISKLVDNLLALACFFDDNYQIEVFPFGAKSFPVRKVSLHDYKGTAEKIIQANGFSGGTNYVDPVSDLREYYFKSSGKPTPGAHSDELPVFAIFATDGECNEDFKEAARVQFRYASQFPVFFKFVALKGQQTSDVFEFLQSLDDAPVVGDTDPKFSHIPDNLRYYIDNTDFVLVDGPDSVTIQDFLREYPGYLDEAYRQKGLLDRDPSVDVSKLKKEGRKEAPAIAVAPAPVVAIVPAPAVAIAPAPAATFTPAFAVAPAAAVPAPAPASVPAPAKACCVIL